MKKRILSLLMAVVILFQVIPATVQTVVAEDEVMGIDVYDLEVGKQYRAVWDYSYEATVAIYKLDAEGDEVEAYPGQLLKESLPQDLIVTILEDGDYFVYVTNDDWPATCMDYRLVESVDVIILECIEPDEPEAPGPSQVSLTVNGEAVSRLVLDPGEKTYILTDLAGEIAEGAASYQWQLLSPDGEWVNIKDYFLPYAIISEALIKNAVNSEGVTYVRCVVSDGMQILTSDPMEVSMKNNAVSYFKMRSLAPTAASAGTGTEVGTDENAGISLASEEETRAGATAFQIAINYVFLHADNEDINGTTAANTFTLTLSTASPFTGDIISPPVVGYRPFVETTGDTFEKEYAGKKLVSANTYHFNGQREEAHVTIYYVPKDDVSYRVRYFRQNLQDDEYTEYETLYRKGTADTAVGVGHNPDDVAGFSPLAYDEKAIISSDGGTVIDVYYDRNYYLVKYDLGEGYGVMPSYVRYGTTVMLGTPTNPGYTFDGWQLTAVNGETDNLTTTYPQYNVTAANSQINVAHNLTYTAKWEKTETSYTVVYWLENADDNKFSMAGSKKVVAEPGDVVSAKDDISRSDKAYFTFNSTLSDKNVTVKGDGTTAVNVYYLRNYYTITFSRSGRACLTEEHQHDDSCPDGTCSLETHTHTDACGVASQTCGKEEHRHTDTCCSFTYHKHEEGDCTCKVVEHTHTDECYTCQEHAHTESCYTHDLDCYATTIGAEAPTGEYLTYVNNITNPQNGYVYRYRHTRRYSSVFLRANNKWYYLGDTDRTENSISNTNRQNYFGVSFSNLTYPQNNGSFTSKEASFVNNHDFTKCLTCEVTVHTHGDGNCTYKDTEHIHGEGTCSCNVTAHDHTTGCEYTKCGKEQHAHTPACQTYSCGKTAHTHTADCVRSCQIYVHSHGNCGNNFYIAKRKYGASISDVWQKVWDAPDHSSGTRWDPDSNIYNQVLVYFPFMPPENIKLTASVVSYDLFTMHYMLESLNSNGNLDDTSNYTELIVVEARYNHLTKNEDFFDIVGFEQYTSNPKFGTGSNPQLDINGGGHVYLYYERNESSLVFFSNGVELTSLNKTLLYQQPVGAEYEPINVPYPTNKETNAVKFAGWYTTENCADGTEFFFDGTTTMPLEGLYLYAKWEPTTWSVKVYLDEAKSIDLYSDTVLFDAMIAEPNYAAKQNELEAYKNLIFNGWYYNDGGSDIRFDFNTMAIKRDYVIFAKWTSHVPVPFKVRYVIEQDGAYVDIADSTVGVALVGVTKSFTAKAGDELYAEYRKYLPQKHAQSMEIKSIAAENELVFVYQTVETVTYTVKHVFYDSRLPSNPYVISYDDTLTCADANFSGKLEINFYTPGDPLQVQAEAAGVWDIITSLSPDAYRQELILVSSSAEDKNEIVFEWADGGVTFIYQVIHHFENDGETDANNPADYTAAHYEEFHGAYDDKGNGTVSATAITEQGFSLNSELSGSEKTFNKDEASIGSPRVLNLYYSRNEITYEIQYVTSEGITTETKTAKYKSEVTINAKDITGYAPKEESQSATITYAGQLIIFYYDPLEVIFTYQAVGGGYALPVQEKVRVGMTAVGSTPTPLDGYYFVGWYTDAACTTPVNSSWVESDNTLKPVADAADAGGAVTYYAKFELATLVISSRITANMPAMPEIVNGQSFIYWINGKEGTETADISLRVAVPYKNADGSYGSVTIIGLPLGTYDITVEDDWSSWRYTTDTDIYTGYVFDGEEVLTIYSSLTDADTGLSSGHYITSDAHNS